MSARPRRRVGGIIDCPRRPVGIAEPDRLAWCGHLAGLDVVADRLCENLYLLAALSQSKALVMKPHDRRNVAGMPQARIIRSRSWCQRPMAGSGSPSTAYEDKYTMWRTPAALAAILLLDEPTTVLDLRHQDLVMRLAAAGGAVLVVLHDLNLAAAHADRIADGRLTACGPPADVLSPNLLSHVYQRDIEVIDHPRTGHPLILPLRRPR